MGLVVRVSPIVWVGLNMVNAMACAYAERSPLVLISGSPGLAERVKNPFLHHMVRDFSTQRDVFEKITVASVILDDPHTAEREIDRALKALIQFKRPIYLEIPRDLVLAPVQVVSTEPPKGTACQSDPAALKEAVAEVRGLLSGSERPVILAGAEIHRFGLQDELTDTGRAYERAHRNDFVGEVGHPRKSSSVYWCIWRIGRTRRNPGVCGGTPTAC